MSSISQFRAVFYLEVYELKTIVLDIAAYDHDIYDPETRLGFDFESFYLSYEELNETAASPAPSPIDPTPTPPTSTNVCLMMYQMAGTNRETPLRQSQVTFWSFSPLFLSRPLCYVSRISIDNGECCNLRKGTFLVSLLILSVLFMVFRSGNLSSTGPL